MKKAMGALCIFVACMAALALYGNYYGLVDLYWAIGISLFVTIIVVALWIRFSKKTLPVEATVVATPVAPTEETPFEGTTIEVTPSDPDSTS